jgi:hypothetical protein
MPIKVSNYDTLQLDHIKIIPVVKNGDPQNKFKWNDVIEDVKPTLEDKGIKIDENGTPVTIQLNKYVSYNTSGFKSSPVLGGGIIAAGGSIAQAVGGNLVESIVSNNNNDETSNNGLVLCDTSSCGIFIDFSIISNGYETRIVIDYNAGMSNPIWISETYSAKAISEMIEASK